MKDRDYDDGGWFDEDDLCLGCGEDHFRESRIPGLCVECASIPSGDMDSEVAGWTDHGISLRA